MFSNSESRHLTSETAKTAKNAFSTGFHNKFLWAIDEGSGAGLTEGLGQRLGHQNTARGVTVWYGPVSSAVVAWSECHTNVIPEQSWQK